MLEGLHRHYPDIVVSLEMFERDVQEFIDQYLAGEITEEEFLENSRPWGNYETDYRPVIEFARNNLLPVIASNVPRPLASRIAMGGGWENAEYTDDELPWIAGTFDAPHDEYWDAFYETMMMMSGEGMHMTEDMISTFYEAQVMKDETMAESITFAYNDHPDFIVYHFAGAFHLMDYLGTFSRIERNIPEADTVLILVYPVDDILAGVPEGASKADYYILVQAPAVEDEETMEGMEEGMEDSEEMPSMPGDDENDDENQPEAPSMRDLALSRAVSGNIQSHMALRWYAQIYGITVEVTDSVATICMTLKTDELRDKAIQLAQNTDGVTEVIDNIIVDPSIEDPPFEI